MRRNVRTPGSPALSVLAGALASMGTDDAGGARKRSEKHIACSKQAQRGLSMSNTSKLVCKQTAGVIVPVVNLKRCEGKSDCAVVCPEHVFEIRHIDAVDYQRLGALQKFKLRVHGMKVA